jgi:hypothetical protein
MSVMGSFCPFMTVDSDTKMVPVSSMPRILNPLNVKNHHKFVCHATMVKTGAEPRASIGERPSPHVQVYTSNQADVVPLDAMSYMIGTFETLRKRNSTRSRSLYATVS